jgi:hypothetical protein
MTRSDRTLRMTRSDRSLRMTIVARFNTPIQAS